MMSDNKLYVWKIEFYCESDYDNLFPLFYGLFSTVELAIESIVLGLGGDNKFNGSPEIKQDIRHSEIYNSQTIDGCFYQIIKIEVDKWKINHDRKT